MIDGQTNKDVGFKAEVLHLLESKGIAYTAEGLRISFPANNLKIILVPQETLPNPKMLPSSHSACQWEQQNTAEDVSAGCVSAGSESAGNGNGGGGKDTVFLYEDRWRCARSVTSQRLLSRLGQFRKIHARLCKVVSAENCREFGMNPAVFTQKVRKFLDSYHTYGFLNGQMSYALVYKENIIAAAQFKQTYQPQNPGKNYQVPLKKEGPGRKYEWTRYACLPDVRIAGGMGKVLEQFVRDVRMNNPENFEVMSYSDNEWSDGDAYRKLGFELEGSMPPVTYRIDPKSFNRINPRQWAALKCKEEYPVIRNLGSRKWVKVY